MEIEVQPSANECINFLRPIFVFRSLYIHNGSLRQQRSANLFFTTLHSNLIWDHFFKQLENSIKCKDISKVQKPGSGPASISELCLLLDFLIRLESSLDKTYLPALNEKLLELIVKNFQTLNHSNLHSLLQLVSNEGNTELFNCLYIEFVTNTLLLSEAQNSDVISNQFDKLIKKSVDLYDSAYAFESSLSESMESMSSTEKLEFDPVLINSQLEVFDCLKRLNVILLQIGNIHTDIFKSILILSSLADSEIVQLMSINTVIEILPKIIDNIDLTTTHCIEIVTSFLWNNSLFDKIFKLYQFYPVHVERVLITQLDYSRTVQLLKFGQHLENNFDTIVLRCLDDLENAEIVSKAQSESFLYEFYSSISVILDPLIRILNETLLSTQNVLQFNDNDSEHKSQLFDKSLRATETLDLEFSTSASMQECEHSLKIPASSDKTLDSPYPVTDEIAYPGNQEDTLDSDQSIALAKTIPVYVVEASGKFKQEEVLSSSVLNDEAVEIVKNSPCSPADELSVEAEDLTNSSSYSDTPKIVISKTSEAMEEDESHNTDEECQISTTDNRSQSSNSSVSSFTNSASVSTIPTIVPSTESTLPPIFKQNLFSIHPYNTHFLIYQKTPDHPRCLYALNVLRNVMTTNTRSFLIAIATTTSKTRQTYFEILISTLTKLFTSFYKENPGYGNVGIHVESMRLLGNVLSGLLTIAKGNRGYSSFIGDIFSKTQLQKTILYTLASMVLVKNDEQLTSTENMLKRNYGDEYDIVFGEIVRLTTCLIAIEAETVNHQPKIRSVMSIKYIPAVQLCRQPLYLDSLLKNLANPALRTCHHLTLASVTNALPFYSSDDVGRIVKSLVATVCSELVKENLPDVYISKILESITSITHYILIDQGGNEKETTTQQTSSHLLYNLVSVFLPMAGNWKEKELAPVSKQESAQSLANLKAQILPALLSQLLATLIHLWKPSLKAKILDLINPIAFNHIPIFIHCLSEQHYEVSTCVDLVHHMKVIPLPTLASAVFATVKELSGQGEENQLTLLQFFTNYIEKCSNVNEIWPSTIGLIRESLSMSPKCQVGVFCLVSKVVIDVGVPVMKQELRELQESSNKLVESISSQISLEKKQKFSPNGTEILDTLSKYLPKVIDILWGADVLPLLTNIVYYLTPHLKSKSTQYKTAVSLIANLSFYSYLRKAWKKEIFEHLLEPNFFLFTQDCVPSWKVTLDNLFTQDKYTFSELIARVSVPASLNLFSSKEIEYESRAMLLKRLAFVIYSSPKDQYTKFITNIQERIAEGIKMPQLIPIIQSQVFLCFRVLLLRLSPQHLTSLWPIILHEILQVLIQMEHDILTRNPNLLQLYLQVCKLLELALNLPVSLLPSFQMHRWAFIGPPTETFTPHLTRLALQLEPHKTSNGVRALRTNKIECLGELHEFLNKCDEQVEIEVLENVLECDFIEL